MVYGDNRGAVGFLIGEEHKGMAAMLTMMNRARLAAAAGRRDCRTRDATSDGYARTAQSGYAIIDYPDQAHAADHAPFTALRARSATPPASRSTARIAPRRRPRAKPRMNAPRC